MDIWKHGTYVDTWSIVHFLSGFVLAGLFYSMGYGFLLASVLSAIILALWEVFEWAIKIIEPSINVAVDLVVGYAGFLLGAYLYYDAGAGLSYWYSAIGAVLILSAWGFLDFLHRGYR